MKRSSLMFLFILILSSVVILWADVPQRMNYQGKMTDTDGVALSGTYTIKFAIYNAATGETPLWDETRLVNIVNGLFDIQLGEVNPIHLDFSEPYWIELTINTGDGLETFEPREQLAAVSYAFRSNTSQNVENAIQSVSTDENPVGRAGNIRFIPREATTVTESATEDTIYIAITGSGGATQLTELEDVEITSASQGDILYFDGTNWVNLEAGTDGQFLTTHGSSSNPTWEDTPAGGGGVGFPIPVNCSDLPTTAGVLTVSWYEITVPGSGATCVSSALPSASWYTQYDRCLALGARICGFHEYAQAASEGHGTCGSQAWTIGSYIGKEVGYTSICNWGGTSEANSSRSARCCKIK